MATKDLFPTPPKFNLPLSKGQDLYAIFVYKPLVLLENGEPDLDAEGKKQFVEADYPENCTVTMHIDVDPDTTLDFDATITGSKAVVHEDLFDR